MTRKLLLCLALLGLAAPAQSEQTINGVKIQKGAKVELVYFTADDCKYCAQWKRESYEDAIKWTKDRAVTFHTVNKARIAQPYAPAHFPAGSEFSWEDIRASGKTNFMIPRWIVYADGKPVMSGAAVRDWSRILRFAQDVVDARDGR
jgi:hypothetical protein